MDTSTEMMPEAEGDCYFGTCPVCHNTDGCLNIERDHWFVCHEHRVRWFIGANLFSSWKYESEEIWQKNAKLIEDYADVKPHRSSVWNAPMVDTEEVLDFPPF